MSSYVFSDLSRVKRPDALGFRVGFDEGLQTYWADLGDEENMIFETAMSPSHISTVDELKRIVADWVEINDHLATLLNEDRDLFERFGPRSENNRNMTL